MWPPSEAEWHAIEAFVTMLGVFAALVQGILNGRMARKNKEAINTLEVHVDGRLSDLLKLTATASHAAGKLEAQKGIEYDHGP